MIYLCCGIWNYEFILSLEYYLSENKEPTFIWNIWLCGYWNSEKEDKSEPIQIASIINIHTEKEFILPPFLQIAPLKTCFSSENVIYEIPKFQKRIGTIDGEMYFDMESRWIEFVASKYKFPRLILKVPFDFIGENGVIKDKNYKEISEKISDVLKNLPYHNYLQLIVNRTNNQ